MPSKKPVEPLDTFETDVPITEADNVALWRLRDLNAMTAHEYVEFLRRFARDDDPRKPDLWLERFEL